ncbi:MAG: transcription antitermination factor NusB [Clostridia bacterium]|nr:transcription antitermination factor NusB [Clostridia bacterium]
MDRRGYREAAFIMLFEADFKVDEDLNDFYASALEIGGYEDDEYLNTVFFGVLETKDALDAEIAATAKGWKLSRLSKVVLNIMRISVYEMLNMKDVPFAVSINEAVELAKKYDDEKAPKFVNGVLNTVASNKGLKNK